MFQGSIFLGDGFLLDDRETEQLLQADPQNQEVIFPLINGRDVNDSFHQQPKRHIINFFSWSEGKAQEYEKPYERVKLLVKPVRLAQKDKGAKKTWWQFIRPRPELYTKLKELDICFIVAATTKYLNFSASPTNRVSPMPSSSTQPTAFATIPSSSLLSTMNGPGSTAHH